MAMRELTESERIARDVAKSSRDVPYLIDDLEHYIFNMGFIAALDHSAAQIAALTAERDALKLQADGLKQHAAHSLIKYADAAAECGGLTAENTRLREAQFKAVKYLKRMARYWREYAADDYCQTYNPEMGRGLRRAAGKLEDYINDTIRLATGARK